MYKWTSVFVVLCACTPGQAKQSDNDIISDYQWEPGEETPRVQSGSVYCQMDPAGFYIVFINVTADDPQGASDLKEGLWSANPIGSDTPIIEDVLYCDGQECIYSFHAQQYPEVPCALLTDFEFWAEVVDYSGNHTDPFQLDVLGDITPTE